MNSVYKWKITVNSNVYYAYLLNDNNEGLNGSPFILEASTNKRCYGSSWAQGNPVDENTISRYVSFINTETGYTAKYEVVYNLVSSVLETTGNMLDPNNAGTYWNIDFSSCGDNGAGINGSCPVLRFKLESIGSGETGYSKVTDSGTTDNGINWYEVTLYVPKGADGSPCSPGRDGNDGTNGLQGPQGPAGISGPQGPAGVAGKGRNIMAFNVINRGGNKPDTPSGGLYNANSSTVSGMSPGEIIYPAGWGDDNNCSTAYIGGCDIYMSCADFSLEDSEVPGIMKPRNGWSNPIKINGEDGDNGTDGDFIEFRFFNSSDIYDVNAFDAPQYVESANTYLVILKNGGVIGTWENHPSGISLEKPIEYMITRTRDDNTAEWGEWNSPAIWAKWGEDGIDGDGVEYIFKATDYYDEETRERLQAELDACFNSFNDSSDTEKFKIWNKPDLFNYLKTNGYPTSGWTDDPSDVSLSEPYEWVSMRRSKWDNEGKKSVFYDFTAPKLWSKWARTPITFDLSRESVGIGTGNDWVLDVETEITTLLTATNGVITDVECNPSDFTLINAVHAVGDSATGIYTITVELPNGYNFFGLDGHRLDIEINATAESTDGEEIGTLVFSISAVQGGKEGKVVAIETSVSSIIHNLEDDTFIPSEIEAYVSYGGEPLRTGVEMECTVGSDSSITITGLTSITIDDISELNIGEESTKIYFNAVVNDNVFLNSDIPVLSTGKSSTVLQLDDNEFIIGTGTDDILDIPEDFISGSTLANLKYGNKLCDYEDCDTVKVSVKRGSAEIAEFYYSGDTMIAVGSTGWDAEIYEPLEEEGRIFVISSSDSGTIVSMESRFNCSNITERENQFTFSIGNGSDLSEDFTFIITVAGRYGLINCEATSSYKLIGVENGADGHIFKILANPSSFSCNQTHGFFFTSAVTLQVFESGAEDVLLTDGEYEYIGYDIRNQIITENTENTIEVDASGNTIVDVERLNYVSGYTKSNLERLYIKYKPAEETPLYDSITLYVNEKSGNVPSADFDDDTWIISTGDDYVYDGNIVTKTSRLHIYYGATEIIPSSVLYSGETISGLSISTYDDSNSSITFTASSGLNLETPYQLKFNISGETTDNIQYNLVAVFKLAGIKQGKDGEYYDLVISPTVLLKDLRGNYLENSEAVYVGLNHIVGGSLVNVGEVEVEYYITDENGEVIDTGVTSANSNFDAYTAFTDAKLITFSYMANADEAWDEETIEINYVDTENPNLLKSTLFDRGYDFIQKNWVTNADGTVNPSVTWGDNSEDNISLSQNSSYEVGNLKSIVLNAHNRTIGGDIEDSAANYVEFVQPIKNIVKNDKWYTLSFNGFTIDENTIVAVYLFGKKGSSTTIWTSANDRFIVDGENLYPTDWKIDIDGAIYFNGKRNGDTMEHDERYNQPFNGEMHTISFKTKSNNWNLSDLDYLNVIFRVWRKNGTTGKAAFTRIKLEEGKVATLYSPNEDDYIGDKGRDGRDGDTPVIYQMLSDCGTIKVNLANIVVPSGITATVNKIIGATVTDCTDEGTLSGMAYDSEGSGITDLDVISGVTIISGLPSNAEAVRIMWEKSDSGETIAQELEIPVIRESMGKMLYSAGLWEPKEYEQDLNSTPFVYYSDSTDSGNTGYYYLSADSASSADTPSVSLAWTPMEQYSAIITDAVMANFGKLDKAVFYKGFAFSQDGRGQDGTPLSGEEYRHFLEGVNPDDYSVLNILQKSVFVPYYFVNLQTGEQYNMKSFGASRDVVDDKNRKQGEEYSFTINAHTNTYSVFGYDKMYLTKEITDIGRRLHILNTVTPTDNLRFVSTSLIVYAPENAVIYENGMAYKNIMLSNEEVELLGVGYYNSETNAEKYSFRGWVVLNRGDITTENKYGANFKYLAHVNLRIAVLYNIKNRVLVNSITSFDGTKSPGRGLGKWPFYKTLTIDENYTHETGSYDTSGLEIFFKILLPWHWTNNGYDIGVMCMPERLLRLWVVERNEKYIIFGCHTDPAAKDLETDRVLERYYPEIIIYNRKNLYSQSNSEYISPFDVNPVNLTQFVMNANETTLKYETYLASENLRVFYTVKINDTSYQEFTISDVYKNADNIFYFTFPVNDNVSGLSNEGKITIKYDFPSDSPFYGNSPQILAENDYVQSEPTIEAVEVVNDVIQVPTGGGIIHFNTTGYKLENAHLYINDSSKAWDSDGFCYTFSESSVTDSGNVEVKYGSNNITVFSKRYERTNNSITPTGDKYNSFNNRFENVLPGDFITFDIDGYNSEQISIFYSNKEMSWTKIGDTYSYTVSIEMKNVNYVYSWITIKYNGIRMYQIEVKPLGSVDIFMDAFDEIPVTGGTIPSTSGTGGCYISGFDKNNLKVFIDKEEALWEVTEVVSPGYYIAISFDAMDSNVKGVVSFRYNDIEVESVEYKRKIEVNTTGSTAVDDHFVVPANTANQTIAFRVKDLEPDGIHVNMFDTQDFTPNFYWDSGDTELLIINAPEREHDSVVLVRLLYKNNVCPYCGHKYTGGDYTHLSSDEFSYTCPNCDNEVIANNVLIDTFILYD